MQRKLTITVDEAVYEGLARIVGRGRISRFIEDLVRPHVLGARLEDGYRAMAADLERERDARRAQEDSDGQPCGAQRRHPPDSRSRHASPRA